jgi:two-component sensor histidine kinase
MNKFSPSAAEYHIPGFFKLTNMLLSTMYESLREYINSSSSAAIADDEFGAVKNVFVYTGITILMMTVGITYYFYRNKQHHNRLLETKQKEINGQYQALQGLLREKETLLSDKDNLINEKDILLGEKDRLLKEVQHRVRNNLQIVMSLLNTQSAFLKNSDAKTAIRESQNRVQSISLIHQKLYSSGTSSNITMTTYISEMLLYLRDSYATDKRKIRVVQTVADIMLDISQAVPLGLILNEAVTNAIKYAFGPEGGELFVDFQRKDKEYLRLTVADHGPGIPEELSAKNIKSLGLEMIRILSKQLNGIFTIKNTPGVLITVEFPEEKIIHNIDL